MHLLQKYLKISIIFIILEIWCYFIALTIIIFLRLFNNYFNFRFGRCRIDVIGNSFFNLDCYIGENKITEKNYKDYFFIEGECCNNFLLKLVKRNLKIYWFTKYLFKIDKIVPGKKLSIFPNDYREIGAGGTDPNKIVSKTANNIIFTNEENNIGKRFIKETGLESKKFVCFIYRNDSYKKKYFTKYKMSFSYHVYRNSSIENYYEALNYLTSKGLYIIRMGKGESNPIETKNDKIIDYSFSKKRSDFLDIWLMSKCEFCFTSGTGLDDVAIAFRKPLLHVNQIPIAGVRTYYPNILCIFKKLKLQNEFHYLNLSKIIELKAEYLLRSEEYLLKKINIEENTSEEIKEAAEEMYLRLNNQWADNKNFNDLQLKFWNRLNLSNKFLSGERWINSGCKIGSKYLIENKHLLN